MQTDSPPRIKRRKPLFALLMSLILPGFGQLYNGEINKAIWLFLSFTLLAVPAVVLIALYLPASWTLPALLASVLAWLGVWLYGMVDAFRSARRKQDHVLQGWQKSGTYVLVLLLCSVLALPLLTDYLRQNLVESFRVPSESMQPTVLKGDILFADKRYNRPGYKQAVQRGDIAIFVYPNNRTTYYIKRIIGLPGEKIQVKGADVLINGKPLRTEVSDTDNGLLVTESSEGKSWQVFWGENKLQLPQTELMVPPGHVFVMGDNRTGSNDSRFFGVVPLQDVVGKARQIWFSASGNSVHWERMGKVLQ
ncbi:signal peptidase I [Thiothrix nivea]|uniref:Signal peptidase I n=1 Tax=Thiothrix nivea (strain ATCC 35100 / DSM 5205 / JP2) TaxID=870187 RepID=A0A656HJU0_THINJ|nr:signal peptidase I [Thiothrix nivea]EIJ36492.1 signal peptidase I [Thiothrix nivea DSM 5205]